MTVLCDRTAPQDYAELMVALGTLGVHPGGQSMALITRSVTRALPRFNAIELCNVFWGLGLIVGPGGWGVTWRVPCVLLWT